MAEEIGHVKMFLIQLDLMADDAVAGLVRDLIQGSTWELDDVLFPSGDAQSR